MVSGQRYLGSPGEVKVIFRQPVDLGVVGDVEPGALHRLRTHQRGCDHRRESGCNRLVHGHVQEGELKPRAYAFEEVEPRA